MMESDKVKRETIEVRKCCMICKYIEKGGYHPHCKVREDIDIVTVPFKRCCDLFILNPNYEVK